MTRPVLKSLVFRLKREKVDAVKEIARSSGLSQSELLRMAIEDVLEKYAKEME